ncbi:MAG TPA: hypothetical protein VIM11_03190 [Tepidisphaeraceae bacterium]|jgi:hypothetical protein
MATSQLTDIPVTLRLSKDAQSKLAERAAAQGVDLSQYISTLVQSTVESPRTLEEIGGPIYQRFLESGTSDDELTEELERAKHEMRAERRARQGQ